VNNIVVTLPHYEFCPPSSGGSRPELFTRGGWLSDTKVTTPVARSGWAQVNPTWSTMIRYAAGDVLDTATPVAKLPSVNPSVLARERAVQHLARISLIGLLLDGVRITALLAEHAAAWAEVAGRIRALRIDNPGSDQQVGNVLSAVGAPLPLTDIGRPSVGS
jgi:hypothetical protein